MKSAGSSEPIRTPGFQSQEIVMKKLLIVMLLALLCVCSRAMAQDASNDSLHVVKVIPKAIPDDEPSQLDSITRAASATMIRLDSINKEAAEFLDEQRAKGDTIAIDYTELERY